jgi:hypothetical protein
MLPRWIGMVICKPWDWFRVSVELSLHLSRLQM